MRITDLLSARSETNVTADFSDLNRDELAAYVNAKIYGEKHLSDSQTLFLESGTAKIKYLPGKAPSQSPGIEWRPGESAREYVLRCVSTSAGFP